MSQTKAIMFGGMFIGLISMVPYVGYGFVIWAFFGGILAAYLFIQSSAQAVEKNKGVLIGGLAGLSGGVINLIGSSLIALLYFMWFLLYPPTEFMKDAVGNPIDPTLASAFYGAIIVWQIIFQFIFILPIVVFGLLGGLVGTAIFAKRSD